MSMDLSSYTCRVVGPVSSKELCDQIYAYTSEVAMTDTRVSTHRKQTRNSETDDLLSRVAEAMSEPKEIFELSHTQKTFLQGIYDELKDVPALTTSKIERLKEFKISDIELMNLSNYEHKDITATYAALVENRINFSDEVIEGICKIICQ